MNDDDPCHPPLSHVWAGDEAGLGPVIGSLALAQVHVSEDNSGSDFLKKMGVKDSKALHRSHDLRPLEAVALAALEWFGWQPGNAAELFAMFSHDQDYLQQAPWLQQASRVALPLTSCQVPKWPHSLSCQACSWSGSLISASQITASAAQGINRQQLEISHYQQHWRLIAAGEHQQVARGSLTVDRLGGRKHYAEALSHTWPDAAITTVQENADLSQYTVELSAARQLTVNFAVKADRDVAAVALASIIAKYAREVEMHLVNTYWSGRMRWLKPTAGYPQDGKRWWFQLGSGNQRAYGHFLMRGYQRDPEQE